MEAVAAADAAGEPVLLVAGGSNLLVADAGVRGHGRAGAHPRRERAGPGLLLGRDGAGRRREPWDDLVAHVVDQGWAGVRRCPGSPAPWVRRGCRTSVPTARRSPETVAERALLPDRVLARRPHPSPRRTAGFGYRTSRFKADPGPLRRSSTVTFRLPLGRPSVRRSPYARPRPSGWTSASVRRRLRSARPCSGCGAARGWCSTPPTTTPWSAGSFFTNPILTRRVPRSPGYGGRHRRRGGRGGRAGEGPRRLADRAGRLRQGLRAAGHGRASRRSTPWRSPTAAQRRPTSSSTLAREVRDGVRDQFGDRRWCNEPVLVGLQL